MNKTEVNEFLKKNVIETNVVSVSWNGYDININKMVDKAVADLIISNTVNACFNDNDEYIPLNKTFVFRSMILTAYTDIELPDELAEQYALVFGTDIFSVVVAAANNDQLSEIAAGIDDIIEYRKSASVDAVRSSVIEMQKELSSLVDQMGSVYGSVTPDDIQNLIGAISNSKLDEKKLVDAIVEKEK